MMNVCLNFVLFLVKFIGGSISHSISVTSDAFNNLTDVGTTLFAWLGLKMSAIGSGEHHPNGHGRFEWIVALLSSASVMLVAWELFRSSIDAIRNPEETIFQLFTVIILILSIGVKALLYLINKRKSKEKNSPSLHAVAIDSLSDAVSTGVVLVSMIIQRIFSWNIDGYCGILVSIFIMYNGVKSFSDTVERIMGRAASKEVLDQIRNEVLENEDFSQVCDLQVEDYGYQRYRMSMSVIGKDTIEASRLLADTVDLQWKLYQEYGYHILISLEQDYSMEDDMKEKIEKSISSVDQALQIISIRNRIGIVKKMIVLELGIPYVSGKRLKEIERQVNEKIHSIIADYEWIVQIRYTRQSYEMYKKQAGYNIHS